ncbi:MAG: hypothetical protein ACREDM_16765, partial [Methylocella sp.]
MEELFDLFDGFLKDKGYFAMASGASGYDSQKLEDVLDTGNCASDGWAKRAKGSIKPRLMAEQSLPKRLRRYGER